MEYLEREAVYARCTLRLDVWESGTDYDAVLRAGAKAGDLGIGFLECGLRELERVGHITRNGKTYVITPQGQAAREQLLAQ